MPLDPTERLLFQTGIRAMIKLALSVKMRERCRPALFLKYPRPIRFGDRDLRTRVRRQVPQPGTHSCDTPRTCVARRLSSQSACLARHLGCSQRTQRSLERFAGAAHHGRHLPLGLREQPNSWALLTTCRSQLWRRTVGPRPFWRALPEIWPCGIIRRIFFLKPCDSTWWKEVKRTVSGPAGSGALTLIKLSLLKLHSMRPFVRMDADKSACTYLS